MVGHPVQPLEKDRTLRFAGYSLIGSNELIDLLKDARGKELSIDRCILNREFIQSLRDAFKKHTDTGLLIQEWDTLYKELVSNLDRLDETLAKANKERKCNEDRFNKLLKVLRDNKLKAQYTITYEKEVDDNFSDKYKNNSNPNVESLLLEFSEEDIKDSNLTYSNVHNIAWKWGNKYAYKCRACQTFFFIDNEPMLHSSIICDNCKQECKVVDVYKDGEFMYNDDEQCNTDTNTYNHIGIFQLGVNASVPDWFMDMITSNRIVIYDPVDRSPFDTKHCPEKTAEVKTPYGIKTACYKDHILYMYGDLYVCDCSEDINEEIYVRKLQHNCKKTTCSYYIPGQCSHPSPSLTHAACSAEIIKYKLTELEGK